MKAQKKFDKMGILTDDPTTFSRDFKSDDHMARVKQRLVFEQQKMDAFEQRKQQQEHKKVSKKLQAEKKKEKAARKKSNTKRSAEQYRAHRGQQI